MEALDTEIARISDLQAAAGWNHWAILGALAALLWLALDTWESGNFILRNAFLLTVAISMTWKVIRSCLGMLDTSPLPASQMSNRYWSISVLLGMARTNVAFSLIKAAGFFSIVMFLTSPLLWILKVNFGADVLLCAGALGISLWNDFPEISSVGKQKHLPEWVLRGLVLFSIGIPYFMCFAAWGIIWLNLAGLTSHDLRLALLASALLFLMTIAVETRIPMIYSQAFRTIRQNLAFDRTTLAEAQVQIDILLIGKTLTQALQPHYSKLMAALDDARTHQTNFHNWVLDLVKVVKDFKDLGDPPDETKKAAIIKAFKTASEKCKDGDKEVIESITNAKTLAKKFADRLVYLGSLSPLSPADAAEGQLLQEPIGKMLDTLGEQGKATRAELKNAKELLGLISMD